MRINYFSFCCTLLLLLFGFVTKTEAQTPLQGIKICLDPGHGGQDSNDRQTDLGLPIFYYEAAANWEAMGYLDSMLQKLGASVKLTRLTDDPNDPNRDPSLSDRVQVSNAFGADYFHSFHTNGASNQSVNYTLMLYAGVADGNPDRVEALQMAEIMDDELFNYMRTTDKFARADIPFTGFTNGLGVLNGLNAPGTLSEASFHSNIEEGRRLMNSGYRKAAAWAVLKSFLKFYEQPDLAYGEIGGIVTDINGNPLNGITVTINPGETDEKIYEGDEFLNGYYFFDWLPAGTYPVLISKFGYDSKLLEVNVTEGNYTETDAQLTAAGGAPAIPEITFLGAMGESGVEVKFTSNTETTLLGYRLYYASSDDLNVWNLAADETVLDKNSTGISINSSADFMVVPNTEVTHFKLTAVAESGAESESGFIMSRVGGEGTDNVLIVDGFDRRSGSYTEKYHDFFIEYTKSVRDSKLATVSNTFNQEVISGSVNLSNYELVIWFLGDESTVDETFSDQEQQIVSTYLENGGKLLVSGSEIAWDLGNNGSSTDQAFLENYLKANYVSDGQSSFTPASGIEGTLFEGLQINFGINYPEDYPDDISPTGTAESILTYSVAGTTAGLGYLGTFGQGTIEGGLVYVSFPLETVLFDELRPFMKKALDYLTVGEYFPIPPLRPNLNSVIASDGGVSVDWKANTDENLIGYRLYYTEDVNLLNWKLVADESVLTKTSDDLQIEYTNFQDTPSSSVSLYRISAISEGGFESTFSDIYASTYAQSDIKVAIVDGFDRSSGSYKQGDHEFSKDYLQAIQTISSVQIDTYDNDHVESGAVNLDTYPVVIWILGDESTANQTFTEAEQNIVKSYLEAGGNLVISGSEVGWDLFNSGSDTDKAFYNDYLKASYISDGNSSLRPALGEAGTSFENLSLLYGEVYPEDFPDEILPRTGAEKLLTYSNSTAAAGIGFKGTYGSFYKPTSMQYFAFPLETLLPSDLQKAMSAIFDYMSVFDAVGPSAGNDQVGTDYKTTVQIDVLANDYDVNYDMDSSSIALVQMPQGGTASVQGKIITYTPLEGFSGVDNFTYELSDKQANKSNLATVSVDVGELVLNTQEAINESIILYPNPADDNLFLRLPSNLAKELNLDIQLTDLNGRENSLPWVRVGQDLIKMDVSQLSSGVYVILLSNDQFSFFKKWIKN